MPDLFQPEDEELPPASELEGIAEVTEADVDGAVSEWEDNPPDDEFKNILEAE